MIIPISGGRTVRSSIGPVGGGGGALRGSGATVRGCGGG